MALTELENAVLKAIELPMGLAALAMVQDQITRGDEARVSYLDRNLPKDVRSAAMKEGRDANMALALVAAAQEVAGISA